MLVRNWVSLTKGYGPPIPQTEQPRDGPNLGKRPRTPYPGSFEHSVHVWDAVASICLRPRAVLQ
jgi:hypothetical protein